MRIDLHCHTKKTKSGDNKNRTVSPDMFRCKIESADVKIVAITNHNAFDLEQYNNLKTVVEDICQVWPGVEIDVNGESRYHLIVIVKPDEVERFHENVKNLFYNEKPDDSFHTIEEVYNAFKEHDAIFIPHFHDKKPAISENDKRKLMETVEDSARVFIEPRNHRTLGVLANKDLSVLIGSDVQDWREYEKCTFADLRLPVASFSEFLLLARRDKNVVKTLLNKKEPINLIGQPHRSVNLELTLYPDVNIIFGPKGTGKTEIIKSLYNDMVKRGKTCKKYIASERNENFADLMKVSDMELDLSKVNASPCEEELKTVLEWNDHNPTDIIKYFDWYNTKSNSNNKKRMRITEALHDNYTKDKRYDNHKDDLDSITNACDIINSVDIKEYFSSTEEERFKTMLKSLHEKIRVKRRNDVMQELSSKFTNLFIDRIKSIADKISDTVSRPSTIGLMPYAKNRFALYKAVTTILNNLSCDECNEKKRIGSLDKNGDIFINYKYRMLCQDSLTVEFPKYKITDLRILKEAFEDIQQNIFDSDISINVEKIKNKCNEISLKSIKPFLGISKQIVDKDGKEYAPSNGEKGILLLERMLHEDADAYFLDEPELGMGNSFIDTDIRPLISSIAKRRKYVIVATHNANIAVRTLPYVSIYRSYENGEYKTYIGNPFDDQLVNIFDSEDVKSWAEESMHSLEGGKEAFYERKDIYESKDH